MIIFDVYLNNKTTEIDIYVQQLPISEDISIKNIITLKSKRLNLSYYKEVGSLKNKLLSNAKSLKLLIQIIETIHGNSFLSSTLKTGVITSQSVENNTVLSSDNLCLNETCYISISNKMFLKSSNPRIELDKDFYIDNNTILSSKLGAKWNVYKYPSIAHINQLDNQVKESIVLSLSGISNKAIFSNNKLTITVGRLRLLKDMDNFTIGSFDNMSLDTIDFL